MTYYADSVTRIRVTSGSSGTVWRGRTTYDCVQCYVSGALVGYDLPDANGDVRFVLSGLTPQDIVFLLAVDPANAGTDYFDDAFPLANVNGNRIQLTIPIDPDYDAGDVLKAYVGPKDAGSATELVFERELFPQGGGKGGWGFNWGHHWGYGAVGVGWGYNWGVAWGFGQDTIQFTTGPLLRGDWPVKVTVTDKAENVSTPYTDTVTIDTYARPATGLAVDSYDSGTDTVALSWTASEDL